MRYYIGILLTIVTFLSSPSFAAKKTDIKSKPNTQTEIAKTSPPAYTLPWQLRSIMPGNVLRLDSAMSFYNDRNNNSGGFANASMLTGSLKLMPELALIARVGVVTNSPPAGATGASSFINPLLGGLYSLKIADHFRLGFFLGMTVPIGSGGGNSATASTIAANSAGILARSAMDNALFAVNYFTIIPGIDFAYINNGLTIQWEATLLQLTRVRGELVDRDASRTNFTTGLNFGYAFNTLFALSTELRYQRWIDNHTVAIAALPARHNLSFAIGPRFNFKLGSVSFKPGLAYAQGLAGPIASKNFTSPVNNDKILFIDLPFVF